MSPFDGDPTLVDGSGTMLAWRVGHVAFLVAGLSLGACFQEPGANEVRHPTPENAPPSDGVLVTQDSLPPGLSGEALASWRRVRDELIYTRTVLRIGAGDTDGPEAFGHIADVAVSPSGDIFALDEQAQEVRIFDSNGRFVQAFGGIGDGPKEFRYANGIALLGDGALVVSSRGPQLKIFRLHGTTWTLDRIVQVPAIARNACLTDTGRIFVAGFKRDNNTLVHEVLNTPDGSSRDFGDGYQDDLWLVQMRMGEGIIECVGNPETVVFAFRGRPIVRAHRPDDGSVRWLSVLVDFVPEPVFGGVRETGQPYVRQGQIDEWNIMGAVHEVRPGYLLLQTARVDRQRETATVRSYLLDASNGQGAFIGETLPRLFAAPQGHVAVFADPYPRLEVHLPNNQEN